MIISPKTDAIAESVSAELETYNKNLLKLSSSILEEEQTLNGLECEYDEATKSGNIDRVINIKSQLSDHKATLAALKDIKASQENSILITEEIYKGRVAEIKAEAEEVTKEQFAEIKKHVDALSEIRAELADKQTFMNSILIKLQDDEYKMMDCPIDHGKRNPTYHRKQIEFYDLINTIGQITDSERYKGLCRKWS